MDNLLLGGEVGGGVEQQHRAEEDGEEAEADDDKPFQTPVAHLSARGGEEGAGAEVDWTGENAGNKKM